MPMEFTVEMLVPCLEELGAQLVANNATAAAGSQGPFGYATTLAPEMQTAGDIAATLATASNPAVTAAPTALAVLPLEAALELPAATLTTRPILAVATQQQYDALSHGSTAAAAQRLPIAVTSLSPAAVCDAVNAYLTRVRAWDAAMADAVIRGCSTQELLDLSEPMLASYIALTDALYAAVAITPSFPPLDEISRALVDTGSCPSEAFARVESLAQTQEWHSEQGSYLDQNGNSLNPFPNMSRVYRLNGNYAAHLVMVRKEHIEPWRQALFEMLAERVEQCLGRFWGASLPYREQSSSFLASAIESAVHNETDFTERARLFDFPLTGVFEIITISGAEERGGIGHIIRQIRLRITNCRTAAIGQRIYVLLITSQKTHGEIAAMEEKLFEIVERLHAEAGVSSRFDELVNSHMARLEADVALEYGHKNHTKYLALKTREPHLDCVFRFNRYFPCYLVDPYSNTAEFMAKYAKAPNVINRLRQADKENETRDFWVLKTYLYYDCSIKRTAELMNMHRNTVIYRLDKIRSEYHIDLNDADTRIFLHYLFGVLD